MAKTIEQIFESRVKADKFHEEWQKYHDISEKRATNKATLYSVIVGLILPWIIFLPITKWIAEQGYPPIVYIGIFVIILYVVAGIIKFEIEENLYKWILDKNYHYPLQNLTSGFGISYETELVESTKNIKTNTNRVKTKIKFNNHELVNRITFEIKPTSKITSYAWFILAITFAIVSWLIFVQLGTKIG